MQLRIETNIRVKKIKNPVKARDIDLGICSIVKVLNEDNKWCFVGITPYYDNAFYAAEYINASIKNNEKSIVVDFIS